MLKVDSHCHAGESWLEPIEMLLHQMGSNGVDRAVLIQHRGVYDNSYLFECAAHHPGRFAVVVIVDTSRADAPSVLEDWAGRGAAGVRLPPTERSTGGDPLAVWRKAAELGLPVSCQGEVGEFASDDLESVMAELPELTVVVEHLAGVGLGAGPPYTAFRKALKLARFPNVYIKVPGLGEISARPPVLGRRFGFENTPPVFEMALEAFGARRMMWGSDYPPVSMREGYRNALGGVLEHPAFQSGDDREWVMGKTAQGVFGTA